MEKSFEGFATAKGSYYVTCSMEPVIKSGDVVIVDEVHTLDYVDPDKVFLIRRGKDEMLKHLENDPDDKSVLWCSSPQTSSFKIKKSDIDSISKVLFVMKAV